MIGNGYVEVYVKVTEHIQIKVCLYKSGKIGTYWREDKIKWRNRYKEERKILHDLKSNGCAICGYSKCDAALDFHHVNSQDKKYQIQAVNVTKLDLAEELNKCILLCKNCHTEKHNKEFKE
jgi:5-methylcytosine-specific restriction endonuclease McrA